MPQPVSIYIKHYIKSLKHLAEGKDLTAVLNIYVHIYKTYAKRHKMTLKRHIMTIKRHIMTIKRHIITMALILSSKVSALLDHHHHALYHASPPKTGGRLSSMSAY